MKKAFDGQGFTWTNSVWPANQEVYSRKEALLYWLNIPLEEALAYLSYEMLNSFHPLKIGIDILGSQENKHIMLFQGQFSAFEFQKEMLIHFHDSRDLAVILKFYDTTRRKNLNEMITFFQDNKMQEKYLDLLPDWYQLPLKEFISTVLPHLDEKLSQLGSYVKKIYEEAQVHDIAIAGTQRILLRVVSGEMMRGWVPVEEYFFLLNACLEKIRNQ